MLTSTIVPLLITTLTPLIVAAIRKYLPAIPKQLLPFTAAAIGPLLDLVASVATQSDGNLVLAVVYGLAGVGLREAKKQVGKSLPAA